MGSRMRIWGRDEAQAHGMRHMGRMDLPAHASCAWDKLAKSRLSAGFTVNGVTLTS